MIKVHQIIGKDLDDKFSSREQPLADWINNGYGYGLFEINPQGMPSAEITSYILDWFEATKTPIPPEEVINNSIELAFNFIDRWDPYYLFGYGLTDVEITNDWMTKTFKMIDEDTGKLREIDTDHLETFVYMQGQDEITHQKLISNPGLDNLPEGYMLNDHITGSGYCEDVMASISEETAEWLALHSPQIKHVIEVNCSVKIRTLEHRWYDEEDVDESGYSRKKQGREWEYGTLNYEYYKKYLKNDTDVEVLEPIPDDVRLMFDTALYNEKAYDARYDYFRLSVWAAIVWFVGPHGRWFRHKYVEGIYEICANYGYSICYSGVFYEPKYFVIVDRSPRSCHTCGLDSYCVCPSVVNGEYTQECEYHLNGHIQRVFPITCGTRVCRYTECRYHPYHGVTNAKQLMFKHGQLNAIVKEKASRMQLDFAGNQVKYLM